jgi:hypothetical protein
MATAYRNTLLVCANKLGTARALSLFFHRILTEIGCRIRSKLSPFRRVAGARPLERIRTAFGRLPGASR